MNTIKAIKINNPCREDWGKMTTTTGGRFCQNCSKTVVDFSRMSNTDIIDYLSNTQKVCGRIGKEQLAKLNATMEAQNPSIKPMLRRLAVALSFVLAAGIARAGAKASPCSVKIGLYNNDADTSAKKITGEILPSKVEYRVISGTIVDENNMPLPGVIISLKNAVNKTFTGSDGKFTLRVPITEKIIVASFVGYETQEIKIRKLKRGDVKLKMSAMVLGKIAITGQSALNRLYTRSVKALETLLS